MGDYTSVKFEDLAKGELWDGIVECNLICLECKQKNFDQKLSMVAVAVSCKNIVIVYLIKRPVARKASNMRAQSL